MRVQKLDDWRKVNEPTAAMLMHYRKLFLRNTGKWITRSRLEKEHIDAEFIHNKKNYRLIGAVGTQDNLIVVDIDANKYFFVHSDIIDKILLEDKK